MKREMAEKSMFDLSGRVVLVTAGGHERGKGVRVV
jgi:hypothetical protein